METLLDLVELGKRLKTVDFMIMTMIAKRMELAEQVGKYKRRTGEKIFRADIEDRRIQEVRDWAERHGLNPHFAETMLYSLINESCKRQMILLQNESLGELPQTEDEWYEQLKGNLLALTERWSDEYDDRYHNGFFATRAYLEFEEEIARSQLNGNESGLMLDLGAATGRMTFQLINGHGRAIGYDLSQHMVAKARRRAIDLGLDSRAIFEQADLEAGIPAEDGSASFVIMNLGTASDVRAFERVWEETQRVLQPGGRFLFSFYNRDALLYRWTLLPWPSGLAAHLNTRRNCLDVHAKDESGEVDEIYSVYARPYTTSEVNQLFAGHVDDLSIVTYPTISSVLPDDLFADQPEIQEAVAAMDRSLSSSNMGAYIVATGRKS